MKNLVYALFLLPALHAVPPNYPFDIEVFDSKTDPHTAYILYDTNCIVPVSKIRLSDVNYIVKLVEKTCGVVYETK